MGNVPTAATQVVDDLRSLQRDAAHQVKRRADTVIGEFEILARVPGLTGQVALVGRCLRHLGWCALVRFGNLRRV